MSKHGVKLNYVWYVGYGSNLLEERFLCYIKGGQFRLGGHTSSGCNDKTSPLGSLPTRIPAQMYFAKSSKSWYGAGVAFIREFEPDKADSVVTLGRMWKITEEQFECIRDQESRNWYDKPIDLGENVDGNRVVTLTNSNTLSPNRPSIQYLTAIALGLKETFGINDEEIKEYLKEMPGIKGGYSDEQLNSIFF